MDFFKWDPNLALSDELYETKLTTESYILEEAEVIPFPPDHDLVKFAKIAYGDENDYNSTQKYKIPEKWILLTTACNSAKTNGYFGAAFWNPFLCQAIIAHRGTKPSVGAFYTDYRLTFNMHAEQINSASTFVHRICESLRKYSTPQICFKLSITGHSLGAWLAQLCTFSVKYFSFDPKSFQCVKNEDFTNGMHAHTVVFESPGCRELLKNVTREIVGLYYSGTYARWETLDMVVYLNEPNFINSVNEHVGTIYKLPINSHKINDIVHYLEMESNCQERRICVDFPSGKISFLCLIPSFFRSINYSSSTSPKYKYNKYSDMEYSLNVFNSSELHFVKNWIFLRTKVAGLENKYNIPDFTIHEDTYTIISSELNRTIACIKQLVYQSTNINHDLLLSATEANLQLELFSREVTYFKSTLLPFTKEFCLRDLYNLETFLKSDEYSILCISIDDNQVDFETSILFNVLNTLINTSNKNNASLSNNYALIEWEKLKEFISVPSISKSLDLLIIQHFEVSDNLFREILQFCESTLIRHIILVTTDSFIIDIAQSLPKCKTVKGFANYITFEDLTSSSQQKLIENKNLRLNEESVTMKEFIQENYNIFSKLLTYRGLMELGLCSSNEEINIGSQIINLENSSMISHVSREVSIDNFKAHVQKHKNQELYLYVIKCKETDYLHFLDDMDRLHDIRIIFSEIDFHKLCYSNFNKVVYFLCWTGSQLFIEKIFNKSFYIPRELMHTKVVDKTIIKDILHNPDSDMFIFSGVSDEGELTTKLGIFEEVPFKTQKMCFIKSLAYAEKIFLKTSNNVHLLKVEDDALVWLSSRGNIENLHKFVTYGDFPVHEKQLIENVINNKVVILSGAPGLGKSATLTSLSLQVQKTHWVFHISLKHCLYDLKILEIPVTKEIAAEFLCKNCCSAYSELQLIILQISLTQIAAVPIYIFFDGYDEIHEKVERNKFIILLDFLKNKTEANVLVTTQNHRSKELEDGISVFESRFKKFDKEDERNQRIKFFCNFWYSRLSIFQNLTIKKLQDFAAHLLTSVWTKVVHNISDLLGTPLHIRILAEVVNPDIPLDDQIEKFDDIFGLYKSFVEMRCFRYLRKYISDKNPKALKIVKEEIGRLTTKYGIAAIKLFLDRDHFYYHLTRDDICELSEIGLIYTQSYDGYYFSFLHESLQNFFIVDVLTKRLSLSSDCSTVYNCPQIAKIEEFIVTDCLIKPDFRGVRFFLNGLLSNNVIEVGPNLVHKKQLCDADDETAFHVTIRENLENLLESFLFKLCENEILVEYLAKQNRYLETPLFLGVEKPNTFILKILFDRLNVWPEKDLESVVFASFFTCFIKEERWRKICDCTQNYARIYKIVQAVQSNLENIDTFLNAVRAGSKEHVMHIFAIYKNKPHIQKYLLSATDKMKQTALHIAVRSNHLGMVKALLQLGCPKNPRDIHGMTPLDSACQKGRLLIVKELVSAGAQDVTDDLNISPLSHAAKRGHLDIVVYLVQKLNVDILHCSKNQVTALAWAAKAGYIKVVKYLSSVNVQSIDIKDCNGMTPFFHAVVNNRIKVATFLLDNGADINVTDSFGITPLHYCVEHFSDGSLIVDFLLERGANIDATNMQNETALKIAVKRKTHSTAKKLYEWGASISFLNSEERQYVKLVNKTERTMSISLRDNISFNDNDTNLSLLF